MRVIYVTITIIILLLAIYGITDLIFLRTEHLKLQNEIFKVSTENLELIRENWRLQEKCKCLKPIGLMEG